MWILGIFSFYFSEFYANFKSSNGFPGNFMRKTNFGKEKIKK
jgi:hypothetical protein